MWNESYITCEKMFAAIAWQARTVQELKNCGYTFGSLLFVFWFFKDVFCLSTALLQLDLYKASVSKLLIRVNVKELLPSVLKPRVRVIGPAN